MNAVVCVCVCVCVCSLPQRLFDSLPTSRGRAFRAIEHVGNRAKRLALKHHLHQEAVGWIIKSKHLLNPSEAIVLEGL
jgi:hypothetical protein